jgi:hypothetical protein
VGPEKPGGTEIKRKYQLLAYADDVTLLEDKIDTIVELRATRETSSYAAT